MRAQEENSAAAASRLPSTGLDRALGLVGAFYQKKHQKTKRPILNPLSPKLDSFYRHPGKFKAALKTQSEGHCVVFFRTALRVRASTSPPLSTTSDFASYRTVLVRVRLSARKCLLAPIDEAHIKAPANFSNRMGLSYPHFKFYRGLPGVIRRRAASTAGPSIQPMCPLSTGCCASSLPGWARWLWSGARWGASSFAWGAPVGRSGGNWPRWRASAQRRSRPPGQQRSSAQKTTTTTNGDISQLVQKADISQTSTVPLYCPPLLL